MKRPNQPSTQDKERHYFERFRCDYPLPKGKVSHGDKPDVILRGDRVIGIEITNFYLESGDGNGSEQRQRPKRIKVVADAHRAFQIVATRKNVEFAFSFDKNHPIKNHGRLVNDIVALTQRIPWESGEVSREAYANIPELSFVWLNTNEYDDAKWRLNQAFSVPMMSIEKLRHIIKQKELKAKEYQKCDAYWLVVIVEFFDRAQDQELADNIDEVKSEVFEKIVVYKPAFRRIIEN